MILINNARICGLIGLATKAGRVVYGTDACLEEMRKKRVSLVLVAKDSSDRTKLNFNQEASKLNIKMYEILSIAEMSNAIGKANKAVIGIKDNGFSKKIIEIINGGKDIG